MNNKSKFVVILLVLVVFGGYIFYKKQKEAEIEMLTSSYKTNHELPLITISTKNEDDTLKKTRLIIGTPIVDILDNKEASDRANSYIIRFISDQKESFQKKIDEDKSSTSTEQNVFSALSITPEIILATPKVFILKFSQSSLYLHRAASDQFIRYIVFDLDNGLPITFEEMFPKTESISAISEYLIAKSGTSTLAIDTSIASVFKANNHIMLTEEGLTVSIDTINVADKSITSRTETIPLPIIESYIDPNIKEMLLSKEEFIRMSEPETAN